MIRQKSDITLYQNGLLFAFLQHALLGSVDGNWDAGTFGDTNDAVTIGIGDIVNLLREPMAVDVAVRASDGSSIGVSLLSPGRVLVLVAKLKVAQLILSVVLGGDSIEQFLA